MLKKIKRIVRKTIKHIYHRLYLEADISTSFSPILKDKIIESGIVNYLSFDFQTIKHHTLEYLETVHIPDVIRYKYKYSSNCTTPNIYNSVYACMLLSLYDEIANMPESYKKGWVNYFDSFQDSVSGFFFDPAIKNDLYNNTDWWGARHLIPHIIYAYSSLGAKPKYEFNWVKKYYNKKIIDELINTCDWNSAISDESDIDNKIMNIGVALQYQRDYWNDSQAAEAITYLKDQLLGKIRTDTGMWGNYDIHNSYELPRMIQFAYHLFRIFIYDRTIIPNAEKIIDLVLMSQNSFGGFGEKLNSSACEDIDALDILIYLSKQTNHKRKETNISIRRALIFILSNQNDDGGFVFRRDEPFWYGHNDMYSDSNVSALFPTWFRTHCIANICQYLNFGKYITLHVPGFSN